MRPSNQKKASKGVDDINAWAVAWASFFLKVLSQGVVNVRGLFFLVAISRFNTDRQQASLPFTLCICFRNGMGPFVSWIGNRYGLHKVTLLGCIGSSIAVGACFFAESVVLLTVFWGIALGIFYGFSNTLIPVILNEHFEKHRVKANGLNMAGSSFGLLALSPVIDFLINTYGVSGTFLITAGIMLNSIPAALIMLYRKQNVSPKEQRKTPHIDALPKCSVTSIENGGTSTTSLKCVEPLLQDHPLSDSQCKYSRRESYSVGDNPTMGGGSRGSVSEIGTGEGSIAIEPLNQIQVQLCGICQSGSLHCECNSTTVGVEPNSVDSDAASGLPMGQVHSDCQAEFKGRKVGKKIKDPAGSLRQDGLDHENSSGPETVTFLSVSEPMKVHGSKVKRNWTRPLANSIEPLNQIQVQLCGICQSGSLHCECNCTTVGVEPNSMETDAASGLPMRQVHSDCQDDEQGELKGRQLVKKIKDPAGSLRQDGLDHENFSGPETLTFLNVSKPTKEYVSKVKRNRKRPVTNSISRKTRHASNRESFVKTGFLHFLTRSDIFHLFCDWKYLIFAIGGAAYAFMLSTFILVIADFAIDHDMDPSNAKYLMMWISVTDILGRLCMGWVTDNGHVSKKNFIGLSFACACVSNLVSVWSKGNVTLLISVTLFELAQCGILINLHPVIAEFIRKDLQTTAISSSFVLSAPMVFLVSPMIGYFRDGMKSYSGIFYILSAVNFICAALFLCVPMSPVSNSYK